MAENVEQDLFFFLKTVSVQGMQHALSEAVEVAAVTGGARTHDTLFCPLWTSYFSAEPVLTSSLPDHTVTAKLQGEVRFFLGMPDQLKYASD